MAYSVCDVKGRRVVAFTDGSYCNDVEAYAFSIYVDTGDGLEYVLEESGSCTLFAGMHNSSGEVEAVYRACECAQRLGAVHIKIFADYIGCKELAYGNWKPRNYVTLRFVELMRTLRISYVIEIIKGHSDNELHNAVDRLAKAATIKASVV